MADVWSNLPNDIWCLIGKRLDIETDRCSLRLVSRSTRYCLPRFPQPPWLLLAEEKVTPPPPRDFVGIGDDGQQMNFQLELPEAHQVRCVGSSGTWLITVDSFDRICLLNPISKVQIDLPLASTFEIDYAFPESKEDYVRKVGEGRDIFLTKVILISTPLSSSSSESNSSTKKNCIAVAIHHYLRKLAIARPGDASWTTVDTPDQYFVDIIFYRGKLYGVSRYGMVMVCDIIDDDGLQLSTPKGSVLMERWLKGDPTEKHYLVEWSGEVLMVIKFLRRFDELPLYKTVKFEVYKLDFIHRKWEEVYNLGDYCLFLGINTSVSVLALDYSESLNKNCIYFTDDYSLGYRGKHIRGGHDMGVFNLEDRRIQPYYNGISTCFYSPPAWVIPTPPVR